MLCRVPLSRALVALKPAGAFRTVSTGAAPSAASSGPPSGPTPTEIETSYCGFWEHIRFRKGWAQPPFALNTVQKLLEDAAEHSAFIYSSLAQKADGPTLFQRGGDSHMFLSNVGYDPLAFPQRFVRELVHSTLSDAKGYVQGLTEEEVDRLISLNTSRRVSIGAASELEMVLEKYDGLAHRIEENPDTSCTTTPPFPTPSRWRDARALLRQAIDLLEGKVEPAPPSSPPGGGPAKAAEKTAGTEEGEGKEEEEEEEEKTVIDVTSHKKSVESLIDSTNVKWENVKEDPSSFAAELKNIQQRCKDSSSMLRKDLVGLEQEVAASVRKGGDGKPDASAASLKQQMKDIHKLLETVDEVGRRIQVLQVATDKEKQRQQKLREKQQKQEKPHKQQPQPQQQASNYLKYRSAVDAYSRTLSQLASDPKTWKEVEIAPEFREKYGADFCMVTAYVPDLDRTTCQINMHGNTLTISGTCRPDEEYIAMMQRSIKRALRTGELPSNPPKEMLLSLSEGRWGSFTKSYTLPISIPPHLLQAQYANNMLSVTFPSGPYAR